MTFGDFYRQLRSLGCFFNVIILYLHVGMFFNSMVYKSNKALIACFPHFIASNLLVVMNIQEDVIVLQGLVVTIAPRPYVDL